jgi:hypothetical protein
MYIKIRSNFIYYLLNLQKLFEMRSSMFSAQLRRCDPVLQIDGQVQM